MVRGPHDDVLVGGFRRPKTLGRGVVVVVAVASWEYSSAAKTPDEVVVVVVVERRRRLVDVEVADHPSSSE